MDAEYDWREFTVHMHYRAPLGQVWAAWATARGLRSFFIETARHRGPDGVDRGDTEDARPGDRFLWTWPHPFRLEGEFLECEPQRRLVFTFGGEMQVEVSLRELADAVELRLHQSGCGDDPAGRVMDHLNCRSCWIYFLVNLKSVLEHDTDLRDPDHPPWSDSVSVGWTPG